MWETVHLVGFYYKKVKGTLCLALCFQIRYFFYNKRWKSHQLDLLYLWLPCTQEIDCLGTAYLPFTRPPLFTLLYSHRNSNILLLYSQPSHCPNHSFKILSILPLEFMYRCLISMGPVSRSWNSVRPGRSENQILMGERSILSPRSAPSTIKSPVQKIPNCSEG